MSDNMTSYKERYDEAVATKTYADATRYGPIYAEFSFRRWDYYDDTGLSMTNWLDSDLDEYKKWVERKHRLEMKAARDTMQNNNLSVDQAAEIYSRGSREKDYCIAWWKARL